jgi:hypothetical protein
MDLVHEVEAMSKLAARFITKETHWRFGRLKAQLEGLRDGMHLAWEVPLDAPLVTEPSDGTYEVSGKGSHIVTGRLSFLWHLTACGSPTRVQLTGNATTRIELLDAETSESLGMWRMEIGAPDAPGCCFHVQILGEDAALPFPRSLPVPRFPSLPATPMAALEFLLSELFQTDWRHEVGRSTPATRDWRGVQRQRWSAFLGWQSAAVQGGTGSPLVSLKAFPPPEVFLT